MLIICNGMMRSGSTLQYNLVRSLVANLGLGTGEGYFGPEEFPALEERLDAWAGDRAMRVVKMHAVHPAAHRLAASGLARTCYTYRDIRDVAASAKRIWSHESSALLQLVEDAIDSYHEVIAMPNVLSQKYEDLVSNPAGALDEIQQLVGVEGSANVSESVLEECSLENAQAIAGDLPRKAGFGISRIARRLTRAPNVTYHPETLLHPNHISNAQGRSGIWRQALTPEESQAIHQRHAGWLRQRGYQ